MTNFSTALPEDPEISFRFYYKNVETKQVPSVFHPQRPIIYVDGSAQQEHVRRMINGRMSGTMYGMGPCRLVTDYVYIFIMKNLKGKYLISLNYVHAKEGSRPGGMISPVQDDNFKFLRKYKNLDKTYVFGLTIRQVVDIVMGIRRYERFIYLK